MIGLDARGGIVTLRQLSSFFANVLISSVTGSIRFIELPPVTGKISNNACHAG